MTTERFNKLADEIYQRVVDQADRFDINDVRDEIRAELAVESMNTELLDEFAAQLAQVAEKRRGKRDTSHQLDLLTGEPAALDAVWKLGDGKRVLARRANRTELLAWINIRGKNAAATAAAYEKDRRAAAELLLHMPNDSVTVEEAVEAHKASGADGDAA